MKHHGNEKFSLVLQLSWKMLQSLKPKVVKDLKSQRFSKVKVYHKHKANQIGVHATQGHMETHTHIVCFRSYYCNYYSTPHSECLKDRAVWGSMAGQGKSWSERSPKPMAGLYWVQQDLLDLAVPTQPQYFITGHNYFSIPCFHFMGTH